MLALFALVVVRLNRGDFATWEKAALLVERINFRHRHAGSDGHFLDHVAQLAFVGIGCVGIDEAPAERFGDGTATFGQRRCFVEAAANDDAQRAGNDVEK